MLSSARSRACVLLHLRIRIGTCRISRRPFGITKMACRASFVQLVVDLSLLHRALVRPYHSLTSCSTLWHPSPAKPAAYCWAVLGSRDWLRCQTGRARTAGRWGQVRIRFSLWRVADVVFQAISDDLGQSVPRRAGSGTRMPNRIWWARSRRAFPLPTHPIHAYILFQNTYGAAIGTLEQVSKVVDSLYAKVHPFLVFGCWCMLTNVIQTVKIA